MTKYYLSIDFKTGNFYETSKTPVPGYEAHVSEKTGITTYRRYHPGGVQGTLMNIGVRDTQIGKQCAITMMKEDMVFYIGLNIYDQKGNFDNNFMKPLLQTVANLNKGVEYIINPYSFVPDETKKNKKGESIERRGLTIKTGDGVKVEYAIKQAYTDATQVFHDGEIPALEFVQKEDGTIKVSAVSQEANNDYLLSVMLREIGKEGRLIWQKGDPSTGSSDKYAPLGSAPATVIAPVSNTVVYTQEQPVSTAPVQPANQNGGVAQVAPLGGAIQPNTSFEKPGNVTVVESSVDDDDEDLPF